MNQETPKQQKPKANSNSTPIRVSKPTAKILKNLVAKCNRKTLGKRVKADAIVQKALNLLDDHHLEEIKESTYSSQDKLEIQYKKHCQLNGHISKDQFLELLLANSLPEFEGNNKNKDAL